MKFFHGKGSCSLGIMVLLEEVGADYELFSFNLADGYHKTTEYLSLNPKAKVPMLQADSTTYITEWTAIAAYLAGVNLEHRLMPADPIRLARTLEIVDYIVATVHMQGFSRIVRPGNFAPNELDLGAVVARGREIFDGGLNLIDQVLEGHEFVLDDFTIADAALFYVEDWKVRRLGESLPNRCRSHYQRMLDRNSVQRAMARAS